MCRWQRDGGSFWRQSREIAGLSHRGKMTVAVIGSINTYLMPPVYRCFLRRFPGSSLAVTDQHSVAVYDLVASGQADLGLISDDRYVKQVDTVPLFKEKMVLVSGEDAVFPEDLRPDQLDPSRELRLPWNPEYNRWHDYWFGGAQPHVYFDQMALLEDFIRDSDCWVLLPAAIAGALLNRGGLRQFPLQQAPPDRIIYSVLGQKEENMLAGHFHDDFKGNIGAKPLAGASVKNKKKKRDIPFLLFVSCSVGRFLASAALAGAMAFPGQPRGQTSSTKPFPFAFADKLEETLFPRLRIRQRPLVGSGCWRNRLRHRLPETVPNDMVKKRNRFFAVSECGCNGKD